MADELIRVSVDGTYMVIHHLHNYNNYNNCSILNTGTGLQSDWFIRLT